MTGPMVPEPVFDHALEVLERLCGISSASGDVAGLRRVAWRLGRELELFGFDVDLTEEPGVNSRPQPVLVARTPGVGESYTLLVGHLDTVLPAVAPSREGQRFVGTGALDMKGGFAALVGALDLLRDRGRDIPEDLVLVAVPDEEIGGPISERVVRGWGQGARTVLVLEPGELRDGSETLVTGRRGLVVWRLDARGRAAHSGLAYWHGRSAVAAAAAWSGRVQGLSERGRGPLVNVGRILGGDSEFVRDLAEEHHFIGTTQRLNVVPDHCIAEGEVRFLSEGDRDRILAAMSRLASEEGERWGVEMSLKVLERIPPVDPSGPAEKLAGALVEAAARFGWTLELEADRGGVSFPNFLHDPSAMPVLDGLGPVGGGMHTREEYADLVSLRRRIALIAEALQLAPELVSLPPR
jgi:glutamate carboxypeptidase